MTASTSVGARFPVSVLAAAVALGGATLAPVTAAAQETALAPETQAVVDSIVRGFLSRHRVPGLSLAIVRDGGIAYARGFGTTAPGGGEPVTPGTTYRLASVTKPFTSVAALQLAEEGKLDLDDPVGRHCPAFRDREQAPTVRQLMAHQGGLRHTTDREDTTITGDESLVRSVRRIAEEELAYPPGEATRYTLGWIVAAGPPGARGYLYGGSMEGSTALVYLVPDRCYALSILTNRERFVRQVAPLVRPLASATAPLESGSSACPLE